MTEDAYIEDRAWLWTGLLPRVKQNGYGGNMGNKTLIDQRTVTLLEEYVHFGGMTLGYRLLCCTDGTLRKYLIRVQRDQAACVREVGEELSHALECYQSMIRGAVTPFSLEFAVKYF